MRFGRKRLTRRCGAIKKNGEPCRCLMLYRGFRCKYHGGLSLTKADKERITKETGRIFRKTGPQSPEAWARVRAGHAAYVARRKPIDQPTR